MKMFGRILTAAILGAAMAVSGSALAQGSNSNPFWNLQMKASSVPDSCNWGVFEPVLKITNVSSTPLDMHQVTAEFYFQAGLNEIEAVHPTGTFIVIYDANNTQLGFLDVAVNQRLTNINGNFAPNRLANQSWVAAFLLDPKSPTSIVPPGGYGLVTVTLRRAGGAFPFDPGCKDFTRVDPGTSNQTFIDNKFFSLFFTQTQQRVCEFLPGGQQDPNSGINPQAPFNTGCQSGQ